MIFRNPIKTLTILLVCSITSIKIGDNPSWIIASVSTIKTFNLNPKDNYLHFRYTNNFFDDRINLFVISNY